MNFASRYSEPELLLCYCSLSGYTSFIQVLRVVQVLLIEPLPHLLKFF